jgi:hypothetical protein
MTTNTSAELPDLLAQISAWTIFEKDEALSGAPVSVQAAYSRASSILSNLQVGSMLPSLVQRADSLVNGATKSNGSNAESGASDASPRKSGAAETEAVG